MDESTIDKDQNGKFTIYWQARFLKDNCISPFYKCDNFTFQIKFTNPKLSKFGRTSIDCKFWNFKYYEYDIQYNMFIINKNDPENEIYFSSGTYEVYKNDFYQYFDFKKSSDKEQSKIILEHFESSNQTNEISSDSEETFYLYIELQTVDKSKNIVKWFIPKEEIFEYHLIPEPISFQKCDGNCIFTLNEDGYFSFQFFFFNIRESEVKTNVVTLHNKDPDMDGSISFSALISPSKESEETRLLPTFITQDELLDETNGWIFDGGLHITIILNARYLKTNSRFFPKTLPVKKTTQEPKESSSQDKSSSKLAQMKLAEDISQCECIEYYNIKLNEDSKYNEEVNLFCKQSNALIPSNGKYTICLNLNQTTLNNSEKKGIYTSPSFITEFNNNEFQIIIDLIDRKLYVKSKNSSLPFLFNVKYSKERSEISSPNGQEIDLPFDIKTAFDSFQADDWLFTRNDDYCFICDYYNTILPNNAYLKYLKFIIEIKYIENMIDGINPQHIESNSSISILTFNIPTDAIVLQENQLELPKLYFPTISYKSPSGDYCSVIKPELFVRDDLLTDEFLYLDIVINKEESNHPIFVKISFEDNRKTRTDDELIKQNHDGGYQYAKDKIRRFSSRISLERKKLHNYQFIESDNQSYFKMKLVMIAGEYITGQKVPPIDISKVAEKKSNDTIIYKPPSKKRNSMIRNKFYYPKYTEEEINKQIESINKEIEAIDSDNSTNKAIRNNDHPYAGLKNQGATCYMNSILQSLFHLPAFRKIVYEMPTTGNEEASKSIPLNLQRLFFDLQFSDSSISTEDLTKSFGWGSVETFNQHDSQEFLRVLLENLMEKMKKANLPDEIPNLFRGKIRRYVKCVNVPYNSNHEEEFYDISVPIKNLANLSDSFESYIKPQELNGKNQYKTEEFGLQDAETGEEFLMFPPILFLHLTRFEYNLTSGRQEKINDRFEFPTSIDLTKYLAKDAPGLSNNNVYDLYGVIVHSGTSQGGHYYAFLNTHSKESSNGQWYQFNDSYVSKDTVEKAVNDNFGGFIGGSSHNDIIENGIVHDHHHDRFDDEREIQRVSFDHHHDRFDDEREIRRVSFDHHHDSDSDSDSDIHHPKNHKRHQLGRYTREERVQKFMEQMNGVNHIEKEFERQKHLAREMSRKNKDYHHLHPHDEYDRHFHHDDEIVNRRERESRPTPISHSAYILIYVRRDDAAKVFQPIKDEDVPQHLRNYMKNKEKEKKLESIRSLRSEFESQIKSLTLFLIRESVLNNFCTKKITGWDEQDSLERACRNSENLEMQVIDVDMLMKCNELYTKIAQIYNLNRDEIRLWRCNVVDNFPLKIIPDSDKSNIGGMRHHKKGEKMTIMIQIRTKENSIHEKVTQNMDTKSTENKEVENKESTETENKESNSNENKENTAENETKDATQNNEPNVNTSNENKEVENINQTETENKEVNSTENKESTETENKEVNSTENKETTETENKEVNSTENKEVNSTENKEVNSTENKEVNSTENKEVNSTENKEVNSTENKESTETENDSTLPLEINNNLMLYIKFFFPALKNSPLKFIGSVLLDLNEDNKEGNDRLYSRIVPTVNKMVGLPEDTKLEAFTERTQDVASLDLERNISSINNDCSFRNGTILIFQVPKETSTNIQLPDKYKTTDFDETNQQQTTTQTITNDSTIQSDSIVPHYFFNGSKFNESLTENNSSIIDYMTQNKDTLRIELRNIDDFSKPVTRIMSNSRLTFKDLQDFIHDKLLIKNKKIEGVEEEKTETKNENNNENVTLKSFYNNDEKKSKSSSNNSDDEFGKLVQPNQESPLLFFIVKIFDNKEYEADKQPLKVASIDTFKNKVVNDILKNTESHGKRRKFNSMKVDVKNENDLKTSSYFILGFYEFKAFYGNQNQMRMYKTQYSENACDYNYEVNFRSPLKLCMIDVIYLNFKINKALNIIGETIYPLKYNSHSIPENIDLEKYRVVLINPSVIIEHYNNLLTYAKEKHMHMTLRIEKIPTDQIGIESKFLMEVCFGYSNVISITGPKPIIMTKFYGAPFLFKVIKDEKFSDSKKRIINIVGFDTTMDETLSQYTFRLKTDFSSELCDLPLIKDEDYLFELIKRSKDLIIVPKIPPESNRLMINTSNTNNDDKKPKNDENKYKKPEQTRKNYNSIKIYN